MVGSIAQNNYILTYISFKENIQFIKIFHATFKFTFQLQNPVDEECINNSKKEENWSEYVYGK